MYSDLQQMQAIQTQTHTLRLVQGNNKFKQYTDASSSFPSFVMHAHTHTHTHSYYFQPPWHTPYFRCVDENRQHGSSALCVFTATFMGICHIGDWSFSTNCNGKTYSQGIQLCSRGYENLNESFQSELANIFTPQAPNPHGDGVYKFRPSPMSQLWPQSI